MSSDLQWYVQLNKQNDYFSMILSIWSFLSDDTLSYFKSKNYLITVWSKQRIYETRHLQLVSALLEHIEDFYLKTICKNFQPHLISQAFINTILVTRVNTNWRTRLEEED